MNDNTDTVEVTNTAARAALVDFAHVQKHALVCALTKADHPAPREHPDVIAGAELITRLHTGGPVEAATVAECWRWWAEEVRRTGRVLTETPHGAIPPHQDHAVYEATARLRFGAINDVYARMLLKKGVEGAGVPRVR